MNDANGDHLRVCGADEVLKHFHRYPKGSPPRVRSRLMTKLALHSLDGITSACAEQTSPRQGCPCRSRDHLRVCGADEMSEDEAGARVGSPPRVRSRLGQAYTFVTEFGITSACAEQTRLSRRTRSSTRDHLRVCGADRLITPDTKVLAGSPPRVRSRPERSPAPVGRCGITSACAEQTRPATRAGFSARDHLRVCGADQGDHGGAGRRVGSPPRVRSRLKCRLTLHSGLGITSACAEQTRSLTG